MAVGTRYQPSMGMSSGWGIALGILMILLGIVAFAIPFTAAIAVTLLFGLLFVAGGIVKFIYALATRESMAWSILLSILYVAAGLFVLFYPLAGVLTLTLAIGVFFIIKGIAQVAYAISQRPYSQWGWTLTAGILGVIIGGIVLSQFPVSAVWLIGLLVGINLLFDGIWLIALSTTSGPEVMEEPRQRRRAA